MLIGRLGLLKLVFNEVVIPPTVDNEIRALGAMGISLVEYLSCAWLKVCAPEDQGAVRFLNDSLDLGESEAIVLAKELGAEILLIDERLGTAKARELGVETIGLLGVLVRAKELGIIPRLKPVLVELRDIAGFWMSEALISRVLKSVGEE